MSHVLHIELFIQITDFKDIYEMNDNAYCQ